MKKKVAVLFGGRSSEHDISVISALQLMQNMDGTKYDIVPVYITREGVWYTGEKLRDMDALRNFNPGDVSHKKCFLPPVPEEAALCYWPEKKLLGGGGKSVISEIDVAIPVFHGMNGEDGTVQGLLELANIPYASSGVLGCAVGMDKIAMKYLLRGLGLPVLPAVHAERADLDDFAALAARVEAELKYPVYVKPANLGSSIGIGKAVDRESLRPALEVAANYDRRILIEQGVEDLAEVNCAVLGFGGECEASLLEMPARWDEFLTFDEKYLRGAKNGESQGMKSLERKIPAPIPDDMADRIRGMSRAAFRAMDLKGVVRIDYVLDQSTDAVYINEVNAIPGSLAFYLWEPSGLSYPKLIDRMIELAERAHAEKNKNVFSYDSLVLQRIDLKGSKGLKG